MIVRAQASAQHELEGVLHAAGVLSTTRAVGVLALRRGPRRAVGGKRCDICVKIYPKTYSKTT